MGETKKTLFKGDYHPAEFYKGGEKITGYEVQTVSGADITVEDTYNDTLAPAIKGNGKQQTYTGKNLFDMSNCFPGETREYKGITYEKTADGILANGVATAQSYTIPYKMKEILEAGKTYIVSTNDQRAVPTMEIDKSTGTLYSRTYTVTGDETSIGVYFYFNSGVTVEDLLVRFQLEEGSTATEYEPYVGGMAAPNPGYPQTPTFSNGALNSEGLNLLPDTAVFTSSTRDGDVFTFADQVYDRILRKEYWTPKEDTEYTIVLDILENTFTDEMVLISDNRFYFNEMRYVIPIGMIGRAAVNVKTWSSFDSVTSGSIWLNTPKTVTGIFKAKVSILLGTYTVDNLPEHQPYRPPVSIELPILRAIPDGNGGFSARDSLTAVEGMPGWYDLRREVGEEQISRLVRNDRTAGSYIYYTDVPAEGPGVKMCSHYRYRPEFNHDEGFFSDGGLKFGQVLFFNLKGFVSQDNSEIPDNTEAMAWLQAQADAGTPLTVWYPLEEPTTERIELGELSTCPYYTHIYTDCAVKPMIEADLKRMNTRVRKITDSDESYAKAVPDGADHASVEMIGGRTGAVDGGLVSAEVESVKCNGNVMGKIPGAVRALTGYGWSAGSVYNSIERTDTGWRYVQRVDALVLTGLKWQSANGDYPHKVYYVAADDLPPDIKVSENFIAGRYANAGIGGWSVVGANDRQITINSYTGAINLSDDHFDPSNAGSMYYERKEPIITDVTGLMSDFPKGFAVESGGTLTLENPAEMPVPNTITYLIKE